MKNDARFEGGQSPKTFEKEITKTIKIEYLLYLPRQYYESEEPMPLILFLHGRGERGDDLEKIKKHGPPKILQDKDDFPFVVVSPQCPDDTWWSAEVLDALLDEVLAEYRVDEDRVYLTGLSMGGYGAWSFAQASPGRFAAVAPICGGGERRRARLIKDIPIWVFHGAKDNTVPIKESQAMVDALEECGGNVKFTIYPDAGHDSWTETYNNPELYEWFLRHKRGE